MSRTGSRMRIGALILSGWVLLGYVVPSLEAQSYDVSDLGVFGINVFDAHINESGVVLTDYDGGWLLSVSGQLNYVNNGGRGNGINDFGDVVANDSNGALAFGVLWQNGSSSPLNLLPGDSISDATDINNLGQVVGFSGFTQSMANNTVFPHAVVWQNGQITELGLLPGESYSTARAINDQGQVVGYFTQFLGSDAHAAFWNGTQVIPLGSFAIAGDSWAEDINSNAQIVGSSRMPDGTIHAFLWDNGQMMDLGTLPIPGDFDRSFALAVNDSGQVVGFSDGAAGPSSSRPFIWSGGTMDDLNDLIPANSGWILERASDINNQGQIVGWGTFNGVEGPFLLTPVPEPASWSMLALGFALCASVCHRYRQLRAGR